MSDQQIKFTLPNGQEVYTGNLVPDVLPVSFKPYPPTRVRPLSEFVDILKQVKKIRKDISAEMKLAKWLKNQGRRGSCFPSGTFVRMGDGSIKEIQDVKLLDEVLTAEGNVRRVVRTMVRSHTGHIYRLNVWGHRHLLATGEHPILTKNGYKAIETLTKDDWVAFPKYMPKTDCLIETSEYIKARSAADLKRINIRHSQSLSVASRSTSVITSSPIPPVVALDNDFGWLVGIILAEGSIDRSKVTIHLHAKEESTIAAKASAILKDKFDVETVVATRNGKPNSLVCKFYGVLWAEFFKSLCANGAAEKRIHPDLCKGSKEFLEGVLQGWLDGDGIGNDTEKTDERNKVGGVTVSKMLAMQMYDIATYLGYCPVVQQQRVRINPKHGIKNRRLRYTVYWSKDRKDGEEWSHSWLQKSEQDEKHVYRKVASIEKEQFSGNVFNLEVEGDNSYVAESIGVHNCNAYMVRNMWGVLTYRMFGRWIDISPEHLYCRINGGRDAGSMLDDGMVEMTDNGCTLWDQQWYEQFQARSIPMEMMRHANEQGKQQRFQECYQASRQSVEACWQSLCCSLLDGGAVGVAVHVGNNYLRSGKGIAGFDRGPGNHAIAGSDVELLTDTPRSWADVVIKSPQSWGPDFADGNVTTLSIRHIEEPMKYHGLYCVRSIWEPDYIRKEFKA